jgi:putative transposase
LYYHIVWTTRERQPLIDADGARFLCRYLRVVAKQERTLVLQIGIVSTHVHLLVRAHPTTSVPKLLQRLKGGSSVIGARQDRPGGRTIRWAAGYSISSVSRRAVPAIREYLRQQPVRHPGEAIPNWRGDPGVDEVIRQDGPGKI